MSSWLPLSVIQCQSGFAGPARTRSITPLLIRPAIYVVAEEDDRARTSARFDHRQKLSQRLQAPMDVANGERITHEIHSSGMQPGCQRCLSRTPDNIRNHSFASEYMTKKAPSSLTGLLVCKRRLTGAYAASSCASSSSTALPRFGPLFRLASTRRTASVSDILLTAAISRAMRSSAAS